VADTAAGNRTLWVRSLDSTVAQPLTGAAGAVDASWSPDSNSIVFVGELSTGLKRIDAAGGPVITLTNIGSASRGTWGRDGTIVFARQGEGLYQVSSNGGRVSVVTILDANRGETQHRWPFLLPDGRHLLFQATITDQSSGGNVYEIRILDLKTKKQKVLLRADSNAEYSNGYLLYVVQGNLMAQPFDVSSLALSGDPVPIAQQVPVSGIGKGVFSTGPSGLLAFESGDAATRQLVWYTRAGKETGQVGNPGQYNTVSLSRDGTRVATSLAQGTTRDIWVTELARGIATRLTVDGRGANYPVWSGDGTKVIYADRASGIYAQASNGLGRAELVEQLAQVGPNIPAPNSISPDGKLLAYMSFATGSSPRLWIHQLVPEKPDAKDYPLLGTTFPEAHAQFSPDGHWLTYSSEETGKGEVYIVPFPSLSSKLQISTSGGFQPRWRRDGKEISYIAPDGKMMAVAVEVSGNSLKPDTPKALFQTRIVTATRGFHQYDVTADGQRFLVNSLMEQASEPITIYANWTAGLKK
jgi:Tol biopolymer transport system component